VAGDDEVLPAAETGLDMGMLGLVVSLGGGGVLMSCFCHWESWELEETYHQWEFQDPKMEVPTIYKAYIRAM